MRLLSFLLLTFVACARGAAAAPDSATSPAATGAAPSSSSTRSDHAIKTEHRPQESTFHGLLPSELQLDPNAPAEPARSKTKKALPAQLQQPAGAAARNLPAQAQPASSTTTRLLPIQPEPAASATMRLVPPAVQPIGGADPRMLPKQSQPGASALRLLPAQSQSNSSAVLRVLPVQPQTDDNAAMRVLPVQPQSHATSAARVLPVQSDTDAAPRMSPARLQPVDDQNATPAGTSPVVDAPAPVATEQPGGTPDKPVDAASSAKVQPPALLQRPPIPTPPAVTLLPPRARHERNPLAWRARAYELVNSSKPGGLRLKHDFSANATETYSALTEACEQLGLHVDSASSAAKQLAVRCAPDDRLLILFVTESNGTDQSTVVAGLYPDSKSFKSGIIENVLSKTEAILNEKGML